MPIDYRREDKLSHFLHIILYFSMLFMYIHWLVGVKSFKIETLFILNFDLVCCQKVMLKNLLPTLFFIAWLLDAVIIVQKLKVNFESTKSENFKFFIFLELVIKFNFLITLFMNDLTLFKTLSMARTFFSHLMAFFSSLYFEVEEECSRL